MRATADSLLSFPFERTRANLERMSRSGELDPAHGFRLRYANPETGRDPFPTMAVFMQWLPAGFKGRNHRSTDGAVCCVVRSEEHTSELQSRLHLVCRPLLEKKK